ncbi:putative aldouronate transport system permease protein [Paenibacillus sp. V4I3]|uniref:carbohydrate ABC transporter permease n=1 Tax=unclassified Paenibacillus TaxID=185978 RepID=UPI0027836BFA|nr:MULTISPECIES: carbohydrate ABC transporter permease [unclassified Paenibacillus]MDQ0872970.1 putative aldouronate transport system permease protein [Paenibacillus sp. V4I3]MDQ0891111.1 putative aldouronate transport system permease protein [Paenibacillus sp. V4I9]
MKVKSQLYQAIIHVFFIGIVCLCLLPFFLLVITSFTDEMTIVSEGYSFLPSKFSLAAYEFLWNDSSNIFRAYGITILVTLVGTFVGLSITALCAYPLSRKDMLIRKPLSFIVFFTLLFNGGLVPTYLVYTQVFDMKNTLLALIIPGLLSNGFYVLIMRTFFMTSIPTPVIESASIDGAGEFKIFFQIVLPLSLPILATVGLMQTIGYWNDWFNGLIYVTDSKLFSLQNLLNRILLNAQFLSSNASSSTTELAASSNIPMESVRMAMAVIGTIPLLIAYPFFQKYFVKGLVIGAVKG